MREDRTGDERKEGEERKIGERSGERIENGIGKGIWGRKQVMDWKEEKGAGSETKKMGESEVGKWDSGRSGTI